MRIAIACLLIITVGVALAQEAKPAAPVKADKEAEKPAKPDPVADIEAQIKAAATESARAPLRYKLVKELEKANRHADAVAVLVAAGTGDPRAFSQVMGRLSAIVKRQKDIDAEVVIDAYLALLAAAPDAGNRYTWIHSLRQVFAQRKQASTLDKVLRARLAAKPKDGVAASVLGYYLYQERKWDDAATFLAVAREAFPDDNNVTRYLAYAYQNGSNYDQALKVFLDLVRANPGSTGYHTNVATCYARLGRNDKAEEWIARLLKDTPDTNPAARAGALRSVATVYALMNRHDDAVAAAKSALEIVPKTSGGRGVEVYHYYVLSHLIQANRREELVAECKRFLDNPDYRTYRRHALRFMRQAFRGIEVEDAARQLSGEIDALEPTAANAQAQRWRLEELAKLYTDTARYRKALEAYARLKALDAKPSKGTEKHIAALEALMARMESETAAMLDSEGALWRKPDPHVEGSVWVAFKNHLIVVDKENGQHRIYSAFFGYDKWTPNAVLFDEKAVWLATDHGLFAYNRALKSWQRTPIDAERMEANVAAVATTEDGDLALTVRAGGVDEPVTLILPPGGE